MIKEWNSPITDPSYSSPKSVFINKGEKLFQAMLSQILIAIKREIPPPSPTPNPFEIISSNNMTTTPAKVNYKMISKAFPLPI